MTSQLPARENGLSADYAVWFDRKMQHDRARTLLLSGISLSSVGLIGAVAYQLQPWRSCAYDDSPAACAMLPDDYNGFLAFVLVLLAGAIALLATLVLRAKSKQRSKPTAE